jgi:hypothetical protein
LFIGIKNHPLRIQIKARSHSISADWIINTILLSLKGHRQFATVWMSLFACSGRNGSPQLKTYFLITNSSTSSYFWKDNQCTMNFAVSVKVKKCKMQNYYKLVVSANFYTYFYFWLCLCFFSLSPLKIKLWNKYTLT